MQQDQTQRPKRVLVVEDNRADAVSLCNSLKACGASVIGPAPTVHYARLIMGRRQIDGAILDVVLFGEDVYGLADQLLGQGVPIIFSIGPGDPPIRPGYTGVERIEKPVSTALLDEKLKSLRPVPRAAIAPLASAHHLVAFASAPKTRGTLSAAERWSRALTRMMKDAGPPGPGKGL